MNASIQTEYENVSHFDGTDISAIASACRSNILAILKLKESELVTIERVDVIFKAKASPKVNVIKMDNNFWLSVALETWEDE